MPESVQQPVQPRALARMQPVAPESKRQVVREQPEKPEPLQPRESPEQPESALLPALQQERAVQQEAWEPPLLQGV